MSFVLQRKNISSVFESQPTAETINLTLAVLSKRKFDAGSSIKYQNKYYQATNATQTQIIYFRKGTEALVIKTFDNRLFATISNEFDKAVENKIQKIYIPPITHPWKKSFFDAFLAKQKHRLEYNQNGANV